MVAYIVIIATICSSLKYNTRSYYLTRHKPKNQDNNFTQKLYPLLQWPWNQ